MKTYNYGILGPGRIATSFAKALEQHGNARTCAVASRDGARAKAFAEQFKADRAYDNYEALVRDPDVDIVYIATPHSLHEEQTLLCLQNKKAVVCEKPLTLTSGSARKMIETARMNQTFLMEGMWSRFNPAVRRAKELVDRGAIGEIKFLSADFGFRKPYDPHSRLYDLSLGGGSILDVGVYPLFLALFFLGKPEEIKTIVHLATTGADESCSVTLRYRHGVTAQIFSSMIVETKKEAVITGTKGMIIIQTPWYKSMGLTLTTDAGGEERISLPYTGNGFEFQIDEVNRCLAAGKLESDLMTHEFSLLKAEVTDEILRQAGVRY